MIEELKQKTKSIISELLPNIGIEEINDDIDIFNLGLDSINAMTLISNLQEAFDIKLESYELNFENFQTISTIVEMVQNKKNS
ncbi:acyl carrier protein [Candidatus Gracilibacteria bacterium]|nr:acyl carrier protein [Candidatus Gracilibacteria bacterium]NJM86153.1 acyl carrier protein [Hydrococcus sp. RU_2_2]NJP19144.1 acyl carrier protein [Hydrococcus sp. CRU_1_1]